jgi:hypothetical protein
VSSYAIGVTGYCLLLAALLALTFASHRPEARISTPGRIVASIRSTKAGRIGLVLAWWWVGWHLFVR